MEDLKYRMRVCLWYDYKRDKTAAESHRDLLKVFGDEALSEKQCERWFRRFKDEDEKLEDEPRKGRPQLLQDDILEAALKEDPSQTLRELGNRLGFSHTAIEKRLHALGKSNRSGKWIPHELSDENKASRLITAGILLRLAKREGFLDSIVTFDEK